MKKVRKRQKKLDKLDAEKLQKEKAKADFEESIKGKYTKEYLSKKIVTDRKMAERLVSMGGYDCMNYWYASHNWDDELSYYVFKDKKSAQIAFESMKESWIEAETDSGKNYIQGTYKDFKPMLMFYPKPVPQKTNVFKNIYDKFMKFLKND